jgi:hypothetical protein
MTGEEHFQRAEELAAKAHKLLGQGDGQATAAAWAAVAQVHATLALADATRARITRIRKREPGHLLYGFDQDRPDPAT